MKRRAHPKIKTINQAICLAQLSALFLMTGKFLCMCTQGNNDIGAIIFLPPCIGNARTLAIVLHKQGKDIANDLFLGIIINTIGLSVTVILWGCSQLFNVNLNEISTVLTMVAGADLFLILSEFIQIFL